MAFCTHCGAELNEGDSVCPGCGSPVGPAPKKHLDVHPFCAIAAVFSLVAFLFGFIITTAYFVTKRGIAYAEYCAILPAFVGLGFGLYNVFSKKFDKLTVKISQLSVATSLFTLFYVFIGFMIVVAG